MDRIISYKFNKENTYNLYVNDEQLKAIVVIGKDIQDISIYSADDKEYLELGKWKVNFHPVPMTMYTPFGPFRFSFYADRLECGITHLIDITFITQQNGDSHPRNYSIENVLDWFCKALTFIENKENACQGIDIPLDDEKYIWLTIK